MNEAGIRDLLAGDLSVLEDGLELLKIEQYIPPGTLGTRNFLDILAKDTAGHWVIIEVKKTDAAAREAAHEVFKYVEAVQRHFGVRSDEIRAIVAAVEWTELLLPFSRLLRESDIAVEGVRITVDATATRLVGVEKVEPVPVAQGRYLAPWHEVNLHKDQASLDRGLATYDASCADKGIVDYVLVVLRPAADFNDRAAAGLKGMLETLGALFGDLPDGAAPPFTALEHDRYEAMVYFAPQILSRDACLLMMARDPEALAELQAAGGAGDAEAELCALHEGVYDLDPRPHRDRFEIGYAAKFAHRILEDEGWTVECVLRRGTFARNALLADEAIIEELKGSTGSSHQALKRKIRLDNPAHVSSVLAAATEALRTNPAWQAQIRRVLEEAAAAWPDGEAQVEVFNPSSGLFSLYFMATEQTSRDHIPHYNVIVSDAGGNSIAFYIGLLAPTGDAPLALQALLDRYYQGRMGILMFLASAGFFEARDADVMEDLGLAYRTFKLIDPEGAADWFALRDDRWRAFSPALPFQPLQPWFDTNADLVAEIIGAIGSRMHGGLHDMS